MALRVVLRLSGAFLLGVVAVASCLMGFLIAAFNDSGEPFEVVWPDTRASSSAVGWPASLPYF
jgi:hypothetical protein